MRLMPEPLKLLASVFSQIFAFRALLLLRRHPQMSGALLGAGVFVFSVIVSTHGVILRPQTNVIR